MKVSRIVLLSLLVVAVAIFIDPRAYAAVSNTAHDIDFYSGPGGGGGTADLTQGGTCSYCHIPHGALGERLWPSSPVVTGEAWKDTIVGNLCWSCHEGSVYTDANADTPFDTSAHQRTITTLTGWGDIATFPADVRLDDSDSQLGCNSCHNPHDATVRPFQAWGTGVELSTACEKCHPNRFNDTPLLGSANDGGPGIGAMHPTRQPATDNATMNFLATMNAAFTADGPSGEATTNVNDWNLGGHTTDMTTTGNVSCQTCHGVHGDEGTGAGLIPNNLLVIDNEGALTAALCEGCHEANPGAAATTTHPIDTVSTAWGVNITEPVGWPFGDSGGNNVLICSTCHQMHYSRAGSSLYRGATTDSNAKGAFCGECHNSSTTTWHHPSGVAVVVGTDLRDETGSLPRISTQDSDVDWGARTWNPAGTARYALGPGNVLNCGTCHASAAHNETTFPGVVGTVAEAEMCVDCHSFNPSTYTSVETTHAMSHYVGEIQTTAYQRTSAFGNSGLTPIYATGETGTNDSIICYSCHAILSDTTLGGTKQSSDNDQATGGKTEVTAAVSLLLEQSGNDTPDTVAETEYLCTGCHGLSPGGGSTHPVLPSVTTAATGVVQARILTAQNDNGATLNPANQVNCESCHRPHDASNNTGALILEGAGTGSDKAEFSLSTQSGTGHYTDQEGLCTQCHDR